MRCINAVSHNKQQPQPWDEGFYSISSHNKPSKYIQNLIAAHHFNLYYHGHLMPDYRESPNRCPLPRSLWLYPLPIPLPDTTLAAPSVLILTHTSPALSWGLELSPDLGLLPGRGESPSASLLCSIKHRSWHPVNKSLLNMQLNEWLNGQEWKEFLSCF